MVGQAVGRLQLQLAPTIKHQVAAMLTLLQRYGWNYFSIVTGMIAGHRNFEQVRDHCNAEPLQWAVLQVARIVAQVRLVRAQLTQPSCEISRRIYLPTNRIFLSFEK